MKHVTIEMDDDGNFWARTPDGVRVPVRNLPHLYTEREVAEYFGVTIHTVRYWRKMGYIETVLIERQVRFTHKSIMALVESRTIEAWGRPLPADSTLAGEVA